ncbi:MAG: hypothetical protein A3E36_00840 [Candidatus Andersenbacteria bacterium RIFCSPHIGHO2_12_FULL_45_11b]|uniref:Uncharacterized protein n=1 Tax=Candidatus Andersenbacteria bacterium RIFCSPHIGHO2_12_FULL_45_11b TaxID=1797282 RepID=A0A1G1X7Z7_9BACT|nr:MAG: hypothetical protein A3E36_00840 [Candidatus Andersenbacteria bacterium RIFCSPHIGHO2_12_FULL_45_11b]
MNTSVVHFNPRRYGMNKYLAVLEDRSGRWTSGSGIQAYVFEAEDDKTAVIVTASCLIGRSDYGIQCLGRITGGLQVQKVRVPDKVRDSNIAELSDKRKQEIGFCRLSVGQAMISQLQLFDSEARKDRLALIKRCEKKEKRDRAKVAVMPLPKVGDDIYIESELFCDHDDDDVEGGLARVNAVSSEMIGSTQVHFISVQEVPGNFNWEQDLALMQAKLKKEFGKNRACSRSDERTNFNEP